MVLSCNNCLPVVIMKGNKFSLKVLLVVSLCHLTSSTDFQGCLGDSCCNKVELYSGDSLTLETTSYESVWCSRVVIVRRTDDEFDVCKSCTMNIQFVDYSVPFPVQVQLLQANYSDTSYYMSESLDLEELATFDAGTRRFPSTVTSTATVLKLVFGDDHLHDIVPDTKLKLLITPNIPAHDQSDAVGLIIGIAVPLVLLFVLFNVIIYKIRQRRSVRRPVHLRAAVSSRVTTLVIDTTVLRQIQAQRLPQSPDPLDSVAPPSYSEATPPPKYEDVISMPCRPEDLNPAAAQDYVETESDSAAPDTGSDVNQLII